MARICTVPECGRGRRAKSGLCQTHEKHRRLGRPLVFIKGRSFRKKLAAHPSLPGVLVVPLTKGYVALIDAADGPVVSRLNWHAVKRPHCSVYARTTIHLRKTRRSKTKYLHRLLWEHWGLPDTPEIDHRDGNGLDCRRHNLRAATKQQNMHNSSLLRDGTRSGIKGVSWHPQGSLGRNWRARIMVNRTSLHLGHFATVEEAQQAYLQAAAELHGEFARVA